MTQDLKLSQYLNLLGQQNTVQKRNAMREIVSTLKEGDVIALDPLIMALSDDDLYIRVKAVRGLGIIKDVRSVEPLISALKDLANEVRIEAANALGCIKDPDSIGALFEAIEDSNNRIVINKLKEAIINIDPNALKIAENEFHDKEMTKIHDPGTVELVLTDHNLKPRLKSKNDSGSTQEEVKAIDAHYSTGTGPLKKTSPCKIFKHDENNFKTDNGEFIYIDIYYPINTPERHNLFSSRILIIKKYQKKQSKKTIACINYFAKELQKMLRNDIEFVVCVVPSHSKGCQPSGIREIAKKICVSPIVDGTMVIERNKDLLEKHLGGERNLKIEKEALSIMQQELIMDKPVLVIDDVTTTGASFCAVKEILIEKGASYVASLALGKTYLAYQI